MANKNKGNLLYVDDTSSKVDVQLPNIKVIGVMLSRGSAASDPELQLADYDATTPVVLMKLELGTNENSHYFDFSSTPLVFPSGLTIPASGLTANANATVITRKNERN